MFKEKIKALISKGSGEENKTNNENNVNSGDNETTKNYNTDLTAYEKNKVKEYLESTYEINKNNISIE